MKNSFGSASTLKVGDRSFGIHSLPAASKALPGIARLPFSLKILLENLLRTEDGVTVRADDIEALSKWDPKAEPAGRSRSRRAASCSRTSPASPPSSISRRCATR